MRDDQAGVRTEQGTASESDQSQPLEFQMDYFSERVRIASESRQLNARPMLDTLNRANEIARGITAVTRIVRNNALSQDLEGPIPLQANTTDALLGLVNTASSMLTEEIGRLSAWAHAHGVRT